MAIGVVRWFGLGSGCAGATQVRNDLADEGCSAKAPPTASWPEELLSAVAQMAYLCAIACVLPAALEASGLRDIKWACAKRALKAAHDFLWLP